MRVLDIVYRALRLGVSKTRWVLVMMTAERVFLLGVRGVLVPPSGCGVPVSPLEGLGGATRASGLIFFLFPLPAAVLGPGSEQVPPGRSLDHLAQWHRPVQ
jgi:hypothetical protein